MKADYTRLRFKAEMMTRKEGKRQRQRRKTDFEKEVKRIGERIFSRRAGLERKCPMAIPRIMSNEQGERGKSKGGRMHEGITNIQRLGFFWKEIMNSKGPNKRGDFEDA